MRAGDLWSSTVEGAAASAMCDAVVLPGDYPTAEEVASAYRQRLQQEGA